MACVCTDNGLREFPSVLGRVVTNGYEEKHKGDIWCFADESVRVKEDVSIEVIIKTLSDMTLFTHWYYNEIAKGTLSFLVTIPIFGITRAWEVKMKPGFNASLLNGATVRNVKMELKVLDDIAVIVDEEAGNLLCENCGG